MSIPSAMQACLILWRVTEIAVIFSAVTLGNIAIVKIVDALLDALHN
jgi:hypothetical protein